MGTYFNPGNEGFKVILNGNYLDKSGLIALINERINKPEKLICISRPRRFGKSFAAQMLCAYYDNSCDSHDLFKDLKIASDHSYEKHINKYDLIYVDMTGIKPYTQNYKNIDSFLAEKISSELKEKYPDLKVEEDFPSTFVNATVISGTKFIFIIDEWDAPIRESEKNPEIIESYLEFLRSLFKNSGVTNRVFAAAYMTGILPLRSILTVSKAWR